jgi:uncharacterized membrane protein YcjF (UPF0283 family)
MIKKGLSALFLLVSFFSVGQNTEPQMADVFRQDGKIYVVIAVIAMIFIALILFLIYIEKNVRKLEKNLKEK